MLTSIQSCECAIELGRIAAGRDEQQLVAAGGLDRGHGVAKCRSRIDLDLLRHRPRQGFAKDAQIVERVALQPISGTRSERVPAATVGARSVFSGQLSAFGGVRR